MRTSAFEPWSKPTSSRSQLAETYPKPRGKRPTLKCASSRKPKPAELRIPKNPDGIITVIETRSPIGRESRTPPSRRSTPKGHMCPRPSAPPPPSRFLRDAIEKASTRRTTTRRQSRARKGTKSLVAKKKLQQHVTEFRVRTAPSSAKRKSLRFPALNLTPKPSPKGWGTNRSEEGKSIEESVKKTCIRMIQMRAQQISRTLKQVLRSEDAQNRELSSINKRKSVLWTRLVSLEKTQQALTTCMMAGSSRDEILLVAKKLESKDRQEFTKILAQHIDSETETLEGLGRVCVWSAFYDNVVLPTVIDHKREDANRLRVWKKLAPIVNMRMNLKSMISLLDVLHDRLLRNRLRGKDRYRFANPSKLKKYLDEATPIPYVDREFIETYL
uniref:Uncharacterized protein n=1 Tax=Lotharella oceanica TaxID=641309 RepID=A0A7S2X694_9EUKA|mmetsp:Transcript_11806/g.22766  ORF Transcript_11806/g.22766 Transcript_11806/m.22766 type:complete len:386 (+) Transcript_11806:122-1279(+)